MKIKTRRSLKTISAILPICFSWLLMAPLTWAAAGVCPAGSTVVAGGFGAGPTAAFLAAVGVAGANVCLTGNLGLSAAIAAGAIADNVTIQGLTPSAQIFNDTAAALAVPLITISTNNVTMKDLTINGGAGDVIASNGIAGDVTVGISIAGNSTTLNDLIFLDAGGVAFGGAGGAAILITASNDTISNNFISTDGSGILIAGGNGVLVANNNITNNGFGLFNGISITAGNDHILGFNTLTANAPIDDIINVDTNNNLIEGNSATDNVTADDGYDVDGANNLIRNNSYTATSGGGDDAFDSDGPNNIFENNQINMAGGGDDCFSIRSANTEVHHNVCNAPLDDGVDLGPLSTGAMVWGNTINTPGSNGMEIDGNNHIIGQPGAGNMINSSTLDAILLSTGGAGVTNNIVQYNVINSPGDNGIALDIGGGGGSNDIVRHNVIKGTLGGPTGPAFAGGILFDGNTGNTLVEGNQVLNGNTHGIQFLSVATNVQLLHNTVENNNGNGINLGVGSANNTLRGNTVVNNNGVGINITAASTNNVIDDNMVKDNGSGAFGENIVVQGGSNNARITNNFVSSDKIVINENRGIRITGSSKVEISGNTIQNSAGILDVGVLLDVGSADVMLANNTIRNMLDAGVQNLGGNSVLGINVIAGNTFSGNVNGIALSGGAIKIADCNVIEGGVVGVAVQSTMNAANLTINGNDISSPIDIRNDGIGTLDATGNFFDGAEFTIGNVDTANPLNASCDNASTDFNGDGVTNGVDVIQLARAILGFPTTPPGLEPFDFNGDGMINLADVIDFARQVFGLAQDAAQAFILAAINGEALSINAVTASVGSQAITFNVEGLGVDSVNVRVFGLDGGLVFDSGFQSGNALRWNMLSNDGELVANGVYLYVVTVKGLNGEVILSKIKKLAIIR